MAVDTDPNVGVGVPLQAGLGLAFCAVMPLPYTLLSLPGYARIMGINPAHFAGGFGQNVFPAGSCNSIWFRYSWQSSDRVAQEDLAIAIQTAEQDIANYLGYYPAPTWIAQEEQLYPSTYRPELIGNGLTANGMTKAVKANTGKIFRTGARAITLLGNVGIAYTDLDGDGWNEHATVTIPTTLTDVCEIKVFVPGMGGLMEWEIRPPRCKYITGGNFVAEFDTWNLIDPTYLSYYPDMSGGPRAVDLTTQASNLLSVDIYREYVDDTIPSSRFYWEKATTAGPFLQPCVTCGGVGCDACNYITQDGCISVRDGTLGFLSPLPATWVSSANKWSLTSWAGGREPDFVRLYYQAGKASQAYLQGRDCEPLEPYLAQAIAYLATSRLDRDVCGCSNISTFVKTLRTDMAFQPAGGDSYFSNKDVDQSPFGTRVGEVMAWRRLSKLEQRRIGKGGSI